jgi:hypothetical protein
VVASAEGEDVNTSDQRCAFCGGDGHRAHACPRRPKTQTVSEADVENYAACCVKALGGEIRKLKWLGRNGAPDRLVLVPPRGGWSPKISMLVEFKNPKTVKTFPANAHEEAQAREHERLRKAGADVRVVGTFEQVDEMLR